jgi:hypothetical protein
MWSNIWVGLRPARSNKSTTWFILRIDTTRPKSYLACHVGKTKGAHRSCAKQQRSRSASTPLWWRRRRRRPHDTACAGRRATAHRLHLQLTVTRPGPPEQNRHPSDPPSMKWNYRMGRNQTFLSFCKQTLGRKLIMGPESWCTPFRL